MVSQLPPLGSPRAFDAVACRLSFTRAADELHVAPGAISQQVRQLEELLGQRLFVRTKRSVALTEVGMRCSRTFRQVSKYSRARSEAIRRRAATDH
jgi:DNA-binding transcriptional LysR family regulator